MNCVPSTPCSFTFFSKQIFVDIEQPAAGENLVELVLQQLIHAGAARHYHGLDVEVVKRVGDAVEQHAVIHGDLVSPVFLPGGSLRIAAAQIARRQHGDRAGFIQHRLRGKSDLAEQTLRAAAGEIEHRLGIFVHLVRVADDGHDGVVLDIEQVRARFSSAGCRAWVC